MTRRLFFNYLPFLFLIASFFTSCNRSHEKKSGSKDNTLVVKLVATSIEVAQSYVADVIMIICLGMSSLWRLNRKWKGSLKMSWLTKEST